MMDFKDFQFRSRMILSLHASLHSSRNLFTTMFNMEKYQNRKVWYLKVSERDRAELIDKMNSIFSNAFNVFILYMIEMDVHGNVHYDIEIGFSHTAYIPNQYCHNCR